MTHPIPNPKHKEATMSQRRIWTAVAVLALGIGASGCGSTDGEATGTSADAGARTEAVVPLGTDVQFDDPSSVAREIQRYQGAVAARCTNREAEPGQVPATEAATDATEPASERVGLGPSCESGFADAPTTEDDGASVAVRAQAGKGEPIGWWMVGAGWITLEQHAAAGYTDARWQAGAARRTAS